MNELEFKISEMYRMAKEYAGDVAALRLQSVADIFNYVRRVPFVRDVDLCGIDECFMRPKYTMQSGGDCDDKSILAGALLTNAGIKWRIATVAWTDPSEMEHVYLEVYNNGRWKPFDATYSTNNLFTEKKHANKIIWGNTMRNNSLSGEVVSGVGKYALDAIGAGIGLPGLGEMINTVASWFGIKGKTQHMSWTDAHARAEEMKVKVGALYDKLTGDDRAKYLQLTTDFFNARVKSWGSFWGGTLAKWAAAFPNTDYYKNERSRVQHHIAFPLEVVLSRSDIQNLEKTFNEYFLTPLQNEVTTPLEEYIKDKYGVTLEEKTSNSKDSLFDQKIAGVPVTWLLAGGGALLFGFMMMSRGGGRR